MLKLQNQVIIVCEFIAPSNHVIIQAAIRSIDIKILMTELSTSGKASNACSVKLSFKLISFVAR